jgi:hypothetical protein
MKQAINRKQAINKKEIAAVSKKKTRAEIKETLEAAFAPLLPILGKKKFDKRIKKAGKILLRNVNGSLKINTISLAKKNGKKVYAEE